MNKLFFELIQVALCTQDKLSRVPNAREWEALYEEAERQAIVGVLLTGLERLPEVQLPPVEVKLQWIGMVQMMEAEYKLHCERANELTRRFCEAGFRTCVLKGIGMAQYYPQPERRQCGDIDLWTETSYLVRDINTRKAVMRYLRSEYTIIHHTWHDIEANIFDDVEVEVHVHPAWLFSPIKNRCLQMFFERNRDAQMVVDERLGFAHSTARFDAVLSLVHSFHHLLEEGIGLRHIVDYYYVLKGLQLTAYEDTLRFITSIGIDKFASAVMWVLKEVCGMPESELLCEPNEKEGKFLLLEIMAGGNFGHNRQDGKKRNTLGRWWMMVKHYPCEVLWMIPRKMWHRCWMILNA